MRSLNKLYTKVQSVKDAHHPFCTMIVPAAGTSSRMDGVNKLFADLMGEPVLMRTLHAIDQSVLVDEIIIAVNPSSLNEIADLVAKCNLTKPTRLIEGGRTRLESVLHAALEANRKAEYIAVHDGARPLITPEEIDRIIRFCYRTYATAPAVPVTDTIKIADDNGVVKSTPDRRELYGIQTPQVFQADILKAALQNAYEKNLEVTDDCSCVEKIGKEVYLTEGNRENMKITTRADLYIAAAILEQRMEKKDDEN